MAIFYHDLMIAPAPIPVGVGKRVKGYKQLEDRNLLVDQLAVAS